MKNKSPEFFSLEVDARVIQRFGTAPSVFAGMLILAIVVLLTSLEGYLLHDRLIGRMQCMSCGLLMPLRN